MTGADMSLEVIEYLDFDAEIPCEISTCGAVAKWLWRCPKCGHTQVLCSPHCRGSAGAARPDA